MADDRPITLSVLAKFHRDMILPEFVRITERLERMDSRFDVVYGHFDAIYQRFDRLDALAAAQGKFALRVELQDLKARVEALQEQIRVIEERLDA
jgi:cell division protein FtsB